MVLTITIPVKVGIVVKCLFGIVFIPDVTGLLVYNRVHIQKMNLKKRF